MLLMKIQTDTQSLKFNEVMDKMLQAAAGAVARPAPIARRGAASRLHAITYPSSRSVRALPRSVAWSLRSRAMRISSIALVLAIVPDRRRPWRRRRDGGAGSSAECGGLFRGAGNSAATSPSGARAAGAANSGVTSAPSAAAPNEYQFDDRQCKQHRDRPIRTG
jgi:hypothetical protein